MLAVLELSGRRKFACEDLVAAQQAWKRHFPDEISARIVVYPRLGEDTRILNYCYNEQTNSWMQVNTTATRR